MTTYQVKAMSSLEADVDHQRKPSDHGDHGRRLLDSLGERARARNTPRSEPYNMDAMVKPASSTDPTCRATSPTRNRITPQPTVAQRATPRKWASDRAGIATHGQRLIEVHHRGGGQRVQRSAQDWTCRRREWRRSRVPRPRPASCSRRTWDRWSRPVAAGAIRLSE